MIKIVLVLIFSLTMFSQTIVEHDSLLTDTPLKDPKTAIWLSLAMPGAGQAYNESYWKTALILPAFTYFIYRAVDQDDLMWNKRAEADRYSDQVSALEGKDNRSEEEDAELASLTNLLADAKDDASSAKEQRSLAIWRTGLVYLINVLDAYIGAYLFGFDELIKEPTKQSKFRMNTVAEPTQVSLNFQYNF